MTRNSNTVASEYWQKKADDKKILICMLEKWWMVVIGILLGVAICVIGYFAYHAATDGIVYQGYSEFYLDFAADETGEAYQYYNGYTWNDLLSTDMIAKDTLAFLADTDIDIARLEADTNAEIKSDIRVLRVTFTDSDREACARLQEATEKSLEQHGEAAKEFIEINTIKSVEPTRVYADSRIKQAVLLGAIAGLIFGFIYIWIRNILDGKIRVPSDISNTSVSVIGIETDKEDDRVACKLNSLCAENVKYIFPGTSSEDVLRVSAMDILSAQADFETIRGSDGVIIDVPYNRISESALEMILGTLSVQECNVKGIIITAADSRFYKLYL